MMRGVIPCLVVSLKAGRYIGVKIIFASGEPKGYCFGSSEAKPYNI
jgi:hypothetical protein